MKQIFLLSGFFLICMLTDPAIGQTFQKTYGSVEEDKGNKIIRTFDNNYLITGNYGESRGAYVLKVDTAGNTVWQKSYNAPNLLSFHNDYSVQQTPDSGFVLAGTIYYSTSSRNDICLIRINAAGDTL